MASPSSSVQFKPRSQQFALDEMQPPGFRLLWLYPDGKFETDVKRVEFNYRLDLAATGY
jgi:Icc protein